MAPQRDGPHTHRGTAILAMRPSMIPVPDYVRSWLGVRVVLAMPFQTIWRFGAFAVSYDDVTEATVKDLKHAAALVALRLEEADRRTKWPWRGIDI